VSEVESLYTYIPNDDVLTYQDGPENIRLFTFFWVVTCILFWIDAGETIAELPEPLTFNSDEELNKKEDNVALLKVSVF
jgi:hypothetical protein